jgi:hypothetical protein
MKTEILTTLLAASVVMFSTMLPRNVQAGDYKPELFKSMKLVYAEEFDKDGPHKNTKQWEIRQNTQWNVKDGVLTGEIATEEYQKKMQAIGDGHDGTRPVIWIKPVPKAFVVQMRVRYNETSKKGRNRGSLLDLGHHVNSFIFGEEQTKLTLQKKKKIFIKDKFFPLNQWNEVTIEIKEGVILIQVNERKEIIRDTLVTLKTDNDDDVQQIDFKGQDSGTVQIDWVRLYKGIE